MMRNVIFHGELAEFIAHKSLEAKVSTVAETMRFLVCNFPNVEAHMAQKYYKIITKYYKVTTTVLQSTTKYYKVL